MVFPYPSLTLALRSKSFGFAAQGQGLTFFCFYKDRKQKKQILWMGARVEYVKKK
jgi:hypothetical protein